MHLTTPGLKLHFYSVAFSNHHRVGRPTPFLKDLLATHCTPEPTSALPKQGNEKLSSIVVSSLQLLHVTNAHHAVFYANGVFLSTDR